ncbi:hypothetical protein WJ972_12460 [Achromobacter insuavis]
MLKDEALDLHERAARGHVVGVDQRLEAEGAFDDGVLADQAIGQAGDDIGGLQGLLELAQRPCGGWGRLGRHGVDTGMRRVESQRNIIRWKEFLNFT